MYFGLKVYIAGAFRVAEFYYYIAVFSVLCTMILGVLWG